MNFYTQQHSTINSFGVWHFLIDTPIGQFHIVEYEEQGRELKRFIFDGDNAAAERKYNAVCRSLINRTGRE